MVVLIAVAFSTCRRDESPGELREGSPAGRAWFEEAAAEMNVDFELIPFVVQRYYLPESMPGGVALFDYDGDGDLDIYFGQAGQLERPGADQPENKLFRNLGDGTFVDVTEAAGVGDTGYAMGCTCGDYDNDGDVDLYITNVGPNVLYRNNGDGTFTDVTSRAGVGSSAWGTSCAFVDYDGDGRLDIFVVNYINWSADRELVCASTRGRRDYCQPTNYQAPAPDTLYRNNGDGTFVDVSRAVGLRHAFGNGLGVAWGDFNGDGLTDVYVANDQMANQLWINSGSGGFADRALLLGCALSGTGVAEAGMGVMAVDIEHDGDLDLFMSHLRDQTNTFYLNTDGLFDDVTARMGLGSSSLPFTGFGVGFADFDHDGRFDIFIANGRVKVYETVYDDRRPYAEPNMLLRGRSGMNFEEVMPRGGTTELLVENSRAAAFGDLDNDGDVDIVVGNLGAPAHILRNVVGKRGSWVMFRVTNRKGADAVGASVRAHAGGYAQSRTVQTTYSYCASNDPRVHFGLGNAKTVDEVLVRWPGGRKERFGPFAAGKIHQLTEGTGRSAGGG